MDCSLGIRNGRLDNSRPSQARNPWEIRNGSFTHWPDGAPIVIFQSVGFAGRWTDEMAVADGKVSRLALSGRWAR